MRVLVDLCVPIAQRLPLIPWVTMLQHTGMGEMWWLGIIICVMSLSISVGELIVEKGHGLTRYHNHTRPADVLIAGWDRGKPAAFDVTVTSPLCPAILRDSCRMSGAPSTAVETRKLLSNGPNCQVLG